MSVYRTIGPLVFEALVGCHDIFILGKNPIKLRQHPDMSMAVDWDGHVKHQFKLTKTNVLSWIPLKLSQIWISTVCLKA